MQRLKRLKAACSDAGMVLLGAAASVVVLTQTAAERWQERREERRDARRLAAQVRGEYHVYATAAGIVADHYALYADLYEPPHIQHSDHAPA